MCLQYIVSCHNICVPFDAVIIHLVAVFIAFRAVIVVVFAVKMRWLRLLL